MITYHMVPLNELQSISRPDPSNINRLWAGQYSRRVVQLRTILDLTQRDAPEVGMVARVRDNFTALAAVHRRSPEVVANLISGPQIGAWAARCLNVLTGTVTETPLWVHLAHLGSIAAAAAIRARTDVDVHVPLQSGVISLPTLGRAITDARADWALATCRPGAPVLFDGSPPREWQPVRLLNTNILSIPVDDTDPYWTCFDHPLASRLDDIDIDRWRDQLTAASVIMAERHPDWLATVASMVRCLVPVKQGDRIGGVSASSRDAPGAVAMNEPIRPDRLAATLIHEVQHSRLNALHDLVALHRPEHGELLYSPWRDDPRPLPGLLHGMSAFLGVAEFWSREWLRAGQSAELMYGRTVRQLRLAHRILASNPGLTSAGRTLVAALGTAIHRLPVADLTEDACRIATDVVAHHQALWRLRNIQPEPAEIAIIAKAFQSGKPIGRLIESGDRVTPATVPGGDSPLFRLATMWAESPDEVHAAATDRSMFRTRFPGADPADLPLLAGDYAEAQATRLAQITEGATDPECWASLSIAHARLCPVPAQSPLVTHPEVVRVAWSQVVVTGESPLAELVSRYVAGISTSHSRRR